MKCSRCNGKMEERTIKFCACNAPMPIMVENLPAQVCDTCGDEVLPTQAIEMLEQIQRGELSPTKLGVVLTFDYEQGEVPPSVSPDVLIQLLGTAMAGAQSLDYMRHTTNRVAWTRSGSNPLDNQNIRVGNLGD